jgi:hypothetical protein
MSPFGVDETARLLKSLFCVSGTTIPETGISRQAAGILVPAALNKNLRNMSEPSGSCQIRPTILLHQLLKLRELVQII